jgi:hypothetical protein
VLASCLQRLLLAQLLLVLLPVLLLPQGCCWLLRYKGQEQCA